MSELKLKPCLFCGNVAEYRTGWETLCVKPGTKRYHQIRCTNSECDIHMWGNSKIGVFREWNRRRIEGRPRVNREFVKKWKAIIDYLVRQSTAITPSGEVAIITLENMLSEAGVEIEGEDEQTKND